MSSQDFEFYNYSETYDPCSNFLSKLSKKTERVHSESECSSTALGSRSGFFILTNYNSSDKPSADCYYAKVDDNFNPVYSDSSYNNWISGLVKCTGSIEEPCSKDLLGSNAGNRDNLSIYLSPLFSSNVNFDIGPPSTERFYNLLNITNDTLDRFISTREKFLRVFYNYVNLSSDKKSIDYTQFNQQGGESLKEDMNKYATELETFMFQLNAEFESLLVQIVEFNTQMQIRFKLVEILNLKIFYLYCQN